MIEQQSIIEEIKHYLLDCKSDVVNLRSNVHPAESRWVEDTITRINYIQGLLNDLSNMS